MASHEQKSNTDKIQVAPLRIAAIGMSAQARELLRLAFHGPGRGRCELVDETSAEAFILNFEGTDARKNWDAYQERFSQRPVIIVSAENPAIEDAIFIPKPLRLTALLDAVNKLRDRSRKSIALPSSAAAVAQTTHKKTEPPVTARAPEPPPQPDSHAFQDQSTPPDPRLYEEDTCGTNPDVDLANPKNSTLVRYAEGGFLQGKINEALKLAVEKKTPVKITLSLNGQHEPVTLMPSTGKVTTRLSDTRLKSLCKTPIIFFDIDIRRITQDTQEVLEEKTKYPEQNLDAFLWKIALWTAQGRLPLDASLSAPIQLRHWPNLTRLMPIPNAMRMATLLVDGPRSLPLIAKVLHIPQRQVFAFYSATRAIGLANMAADQATVAKPNEPIRRHKQRGLLARILSRLIGGGTQNTAQA